MASQEVAAWLEVTKALLSGPERGLDKSILVKLSSEDRKDIVKAECTRVKLDAIGKFVIRMGLAVTTAVYLIVKLLH